MRTWPGAEPPPSWAAQTVRWAYAPGDLLHALEVVVQPVMPMVAACGQPVITVSLPPQGAQRCPGCVLACTAPGRIHRHRRAPRPGVWARLSARARGGATRNRRLRAVLPGHRPGAAR
jgi:hypothetical protein